MPKVQKIEPSHYSDAVKMLNGFTGIILVFHPGCGHCIELKPKWKKMTKTASPNLNIMEINGESMSENPMMSNSIAGKNTEGFPTIMGLRNGRLESKFNEERTIPNMLKFASKFTSKSPSRSITRNKSANKSSRYTKSRHTRSRHRKSKRV